MQEAVTDVQTSVPGRGPKKAKPGRSAKPGRQIAPTIDLNLIPPAGQLLRSSRHPLRARKYVKDHRARRANKRPSSIAGMVVPDPISIVHLHLSEFEIKMIVEASKVLAKHGRDDERIMTPREYLEWVSELAKPLFIDLLKERLRPKK
jgi:hypothetical protein